MIILFFPPPSSIMWSKPRNLNPGNPGNRMDKSKYPHESFLSSFHSLSLQKSSLQITMSYSFPLPPNLPLSLRRHVSKPHLFPPLFKPSLHISLSKSYICFSSPSQPNPNPDRDEFIWLREEQRWLREEQRWLREEQRWISEREALINEIQSSKLQIQALERRITVQGVGDESLVVLEIVAKVGALVQALSEEKKKNMIAESGSSAIPIELGEDKEETKEVVRVLKVEEKRKTLRKGSEGEEVKEMQEALEKLGFYSGEEDIEFSSFSTGTERAVKTWQASLGAREDGIMSAELLERLYMGQQPANIRSSNSSDWKNSVLANPPKVGANGDALTSVTEISGIRQKIVEEEGKTEDGVSRERVFLLGENRWEDPSRLAGRGKQVNGSTTKCISCRGEGRLLCTECDGTGEPSIEEQFMEWVDEGARCPYCEGLGYTVCDTCEGKITT